MIISLALCIGKAITTLFSLNNLLSISLNNKDEKVFVIAD